MALLNGYSEYQLPWPPLNIQCVSFKDQSLIGEIELVTHRLNVLLQVGGAFLDDPFPITQSKLHILPLFDLGTYEASERCLSV